MPAAPGLPRGRILLGPDSVTTSPSIPLPSAKLLGIEIFCWVESTHPPVRLAESISVTLVPGSRVVRRYAVVNPVRPAPRIVTCFGGIIVRLSAIPVLLGISPGDLLMSEDVRSRATFQPEVIVVCGVSIIAHDLTELSPSTVSRPTHYPMFPFADGAADAAVHGEPSVIPLAPQSIEFQPLRSSSHPSLRFTLNTTYPSLSDFLSVRQGCHIHLDLSFPDALFVDREELRDAMGDIQWTLEPDFIDIERPERPHGVDGEHSEALSHLYLEMKHVDDKYTEETRVKIPLHARYLAPREEGHETVWLFAGGQSGDLRGGWVCGTDRHKSELSPGGYQ